MKVTDNGVGSVGGSIIFNPISAALVAVWCTSRNEEIEKELTLSQYIDELDISEEVLEDNVFGL